MIPHEINDKDNFIMGWRFEDTSFCDAVIAYYDSQTPRRGTTNYEVNLDAKDSFDVMLDDEIIANLYFERLKQCIESYKEKYPFCDFYSPWGIIEKVNIQKYLPCGGFHAWHCERSGFNNETNARHLVFMTYLNDVTDAGETEFFHQKLKFRPEKGMTIIWPADWTFTHRGIASPTQEKMIVTGWLNYTTPQPY